MIFILKEFGVYIIIVKVQNDYYEKVLFKIGVDYIVYLECDMVK